MVTYTYDTWDKLVSITSSLAAKFGLKNPYRYRGYKYDTEIELYYLQSRYYNPEWGRFLNVDSLIGQSGQLLSHNLFTYCFNNPVNMFDPYGSEGATLAWSSSMWWLCVVDGLIPAGDIIYGVGTGVAFLTDSFI